MSKANQSAVFALLLMVLRAIAGAEDNTAAFQHSLKSGKEVGLVLENTRSPDGQIAIIYCARKQNSPPANWPLLMSNFHYIGTIAEGTRDGYISENWIVSLRDKKRLTPLNWNTPEVMVFHPDDRRSAMLAAWTPTLNDSRIGIVISNTDDITLGAQILSIDRDQVTTIPVLNSFNTAVSEFISRQNPDPKESSFQFRYNLSHAGFEDRMLVRGGHVHYQIQFEAIPKGKRHPTLSGTVHIRVSDIPSLHVSVVGVTKPGEKINSSASTPLNVPDSAPAKETEFTQLRLIYNRISDGKQWQPRSLQISNTNPQRSLVAWFSGTQLQMLMDVEVFSKTHISTTFYYYHKTQLVSVFERHRGDPETKGSEWTNTYNFKEGNLIEWRQTPESRNGDEDRRKLQGEKILKAANQLKQSFAP